MTQAAERLEHRIDTLSSEIKTGFNNFSEKLDTQAREIESLRGFKHEINKHIHNHEGKFYMIEEQQKTFRDEFKTEIEGVREDLGKLIKIANETMGAFKAAAIIIGSGWAAIKMYFEYFNK